MALGIRYSGEFYSIEAVTWRVDILQEGYGGTSVGALHFPDNDPLEISWGTTDKLEPVQSSSATLKIISDSDRQFIDLYTVEVGAVRMDVYRNGSLYWSGTLDTELYEEPYVSADGYDVTLTFSDFGCLSRFDWTGTGLITIYDVLLQCLQLAGFSYNVIDTSGVSTTYAQEKVTRKVSVLQENFYDEDGVPMTAREVLDETLRPFALRVIQKGGVIWLYDLNGLHSRAATAVQWYGDDAVLSADVIYNNVKVTFSPYADAEMMKGEVEEDPSLTADSGGRLIRLNYERDSYGTLKALEGFRFHTKSEAGSNMVISGGVKYFQINSIYSGQDETGVAATMKAGDYAVSDEGGESKLCSHTILVPKDCGTIAGEDLNTSLIITCPKVHIGNTSYLKYNQYLRISLQLLFDVRYNPFESEGNYNDNAGWKDGILNLNKHDGPYQNMQDWCNYGYVPIKLSLLDADGNALYHYENRAVLESSGYDRTKAKWVSGAASWGQAYLCYYDFDDRKSKTGFGGWQTNKQIIGYYRDELPSYLKTIEDGEYISLPPTGGYLQLEIGSGVHQFDYKREVKDIYKFCRWILYKEPTITLCKKTYKDADTEDIEDSAWLNKAAKEELEIETKVGTTPQRHGVANGRGQVFYGNSEIVSTFIRAGKEDRLERLLIGTVYSQYASRHDTLSGTVKLLPSFGPFADQNGNTAGKFILLSETQNVRMEESEITMAEFSEDNYEGIEYE